MEERVKRVRKKNKRGREGGREREREKQQSALRIQKHIFVFLKLQNSNFFPETKFIITFCN